VSKNLEMLNRFIDGPGFPYNVESIAKAMDACGARIVVGEEPHGTEKERAAVRCLEGAGHKWFPGYMTGAWVHAKSDAKLVSELELPVVRTHAPQSHVDALTAACTPLELMAWAGYLRALGDARMAYQ
jgi:hypothetical protein